MARRRAIARAHDATIEPVRHDDEPTRIGDGNYWMTNTHLGHDGVVANNCIIGSGAVLGGHVVIDDKVIIGGGFAGIWAALRAAEITDKVVLLDKAYVSRSGASTMSGGITTCPLDSDDMDLWAREFIERGDYMCDQRWTYQLLESIS